MALAIPALLFAGEAVQGIAHRAAGDGNEGFGPLPNLASAQPAGWGEAVIVSRVAGSSVDSAGLTTADTLYVDWAFVNNGEAATAGSFTTAFYVDGALVASSCINHVLTTNSISKRLDYCLGSLPAGTHTLQILLDSTGAVAESDETDNVLSKTILVSDPCLPNLSIVPPAGWPERLVVSREPGTKTNSVVLTTADTLYVDWAVTNRHEAVTESFYNALYVDGVLAHSWCVAPPMPAGSQWELLDFPLAPLGAGSHTLTVTADATGVVAEGNEEDNSWSRTIQIVQAWPDLLVSGLSVPGGTFRRGETLSISAVITNQGSATAFPSVTGIRLARVGAEPVTASILLTNVPTGALAAGGAVTQEVAVVLPADVPPGTWFVWARADSGRELSEACNINNCAVSPPLQVVPFSALPEVRMEPGQLALGCGLDPASGQGVVGTVAGTLGEAKPGTGQGPTLKPRRAPVKPAKAHLDGRFEAQVLNVKFRDDVDIRADHGRLTDSGSGQLAAVGPVLKAFPGARWEPVHRLPAAELNRLRQRAERKLGKAIPDLRVQFHLYLPPGVSASAVLDALNALEVVELAWPAIRPVVAPQAPNLEGAQGYLAGSPGGIGAALAWSNSLARGGGIHVADVEYCFNPGHLDLPAITIVGEPPLAPAGQDWNHGTAVLGMLAARPNGWGTSGICPEAELLFSGVWDGAVWNVAGAISTAVGSLEPGDVILVEQQVAGPRYNPGNPFSQAGLLPAEWDLNTYAAIQTAVGNGIVVVEAAGNGGENLDDPLYGTIYSPGDGPFLPGNDSGAIIVGAGAAPGGSGPERARLGFSNYGSTVDLQGWGERVCTSGYGDAYAAEGDNLFYTRCFNGTSSATPMVTGACALLQSACKAATGKVLSPEDVRQALRQTGSGQAGDQNIGPLPDVAAAITASVPLGGDGSFRIYNDGGAPLDVTGLALDRELPGVSWFPPAPFQVPPGGFRTVTVFVDCSRMPAGLTERQLLIDSQEPASVSLQIAGLPQTPTAVLTDPGVTQGLFRFTLNGPVGKQCIIQASPDLVHWRAVSTNTIPAEGMAAVSYPVSPEREFFRVMPEEAD